ncbi:type II toxin-antitoxin system Phd/YefM family antitoxin [Candidatus Gottesmanbacteria bacterium]|nr:type II toxin-antitoxin system Phd/YefM family antitoxin [Candidatus Gottesmanbacteria bacterium]
MNLVSSTYVRNNLSRLLDEVAKRGSRFILLRKSLPQAVIIPYEQYQREEEEWQDAFEETMKNARKQFKKYLKDKKIPYPKTEEKMYEFINKATGRY